MRKLAVVLACAACVGQARRAQASVVRLHSSQLVQSGVGAPALDSSVKADVDKSRAPGRTTTKMTFSQLQALALFFQGLTPASAFNPSRQALRLSAKRPEPSISRAAVWKGQDGMRTDSQAVQMFTPAEGIDLGVKIATFAPQYLWLLMIFAPNWNFTRKVMLPLEPIAILSLVHLAIVITAASQSEGTAPITIFNDVFNPSTNQLDGMMRLFSYRNFAAEEWPHVLIWDLFVGRFIWLDGVRRDVFTPHSVLLTNLIGPPGLLLHYLTCAVTGKGFPREEALELE